jgi:hypothetical protein
LATATVVAAGAASIGSACRSLEAARDLLCIRPVDLLDSPRRRSPTAPVALGRCSKARWFGLWAVVSLALGCGRSSLLADDLSGPLGDDAGEGTRGGQKAHSGDDATVPAGDDAATTKSSEDGSMSPLAATGGKRRRATFATRRLRFAFRYLGRGDRIRTCDPLTPSQVR